MPDDMMGPDAMGGMPDVQTQLDELKARVDELERIVYEDEGPGMAEEPGPGRTKAPGLAILIGKEKKGGK